MGRKRTENRFSKAAGIGAGVNFCSIECIADGSAIRSVFQEVDSQNET
jgi:hypothetical protein